jgi:hypothetical protein
MDGKPTYEALEQRVRLLEEETARRSIAEKALLESEKQLRFLLKTRRRQWPYAIWTCTIWLAAKDGSPTTT